MTEKNYIDLFWKNWQGKKLPGKIIKNKIESSHLTQLRYDIWNL